MASAQSYIKDIRAQVRANHNGQVPDYLNLTIRQYAAALELKDDYKAQIKKDGAIILEQGSMGNIIRKQHPLCNLVYQQECICQKYAKDLGLTAAKAAVKADNPADSKASSSLDSFLAGIAGDSQ